MAPNEMIVIFLDSKSLDPKGAPDPRNRVEPEKLRRDTKSNDKVTFVNSRPVEATLTFESNYFRELNGGGSVWSVPISAFSTKTLHTNKKTPDEWAGRYGVHFPNGSGEIDIPKEYPLIVEKRSDGGADEAVISVKLDDPRIIIE